MEHPRAIRPRPGRPTKVQREAQRLATQAGAFGLFGLRLDPLPRTEPRQEAVTAAPAPANDAGRSLPDFNRREPHIPRGAPIFILKAFDWVLALAAAEMAALWAVGVSLTALPLTQAASFLLPALALKAGLWLTGAYRLSPIRVRVDHATGALALGAIMAVATAAMLAPDARSAGALAFALPGAALVQAGVHAAFAVWIAAAHRRGLFAETLVLVGATETARRLALRLRKSGEARVIAIVDDRRARAPSDIAGAPVGGDLEALLAWAGLANIDRIVIALPPTAETRIRAVMERLGKLPHRVDLLLDHDVQSVRGPSVVRIAGKAAASLAGKPRCARAAAAKRAQDLVLGSLAIFTLGWLMVAIACAIRLDSAGPALFRQRRLGFNNRVFMLLKFRTLSASGQLTRLGGVLRRTGLDELPQLYNVLKGEMSLVGPRPHALDMRVDEWDLHEVASDYAHRHRVKPGITGLAQVCGARGPIESPAALRRRLKLDLEYVAQASFWLDLQILARTLWVAARASLPNKPSGV